MFKFNFNSDADGAGAEKSPEKNKEKEIRWYEAKEHFLGEEHLDYLASDINLQTYCIGNGTSLDVLDCSDVNRHLRKRKRRDDEEEEVTSSATSSVETAMISESDLIPGVYEGGMKIWECSKDLIQHLAKKEEETFIGLRVLELGCGAGLPGLYCLTRGAHVDFQDYNAEVIERLTIPNVLLNAPNCQDTQTAPPESRFFSGDWRSLEAMLQKRNCKYNLILTSETIYNECNQDKLLSIFDSCLGHNPNCRILIAAKVHYFGVGGGLRQFEEKVLATGKWSVEIVEKMESGVKREILLLKRVKQ